MKRLGNIIAAGLLCAFSSCQKGSVENAGTIGPRTVGFCTGDAATRTVMNPDGLSSSWENGDRIAVWAKNSAGEYTLNNTPFSVYGADGARAFFTATIDGAMPEDRYTYFATYPVPESVSGTTATFTIPRVQDGRAGGGADIMIAVPVLHGPLEEVKELSDYTRLGMEMEHILHQFRFYVPAGEDRLGGESIEKIVLDFPKSVVGRITAEFTDSSISPELTEGVSSITLALSEPLDVSSSSEERKYAMASIFPTSFDASDSFNIKVYSTTKIGTTEPINLGGRTFAAGHSTPVRILLSDVRDYARVRFTVSGNNLGENADAVRLTAPDGCVWGDGSTVYEYRSGHEITTGETFEIVFEDIDAYRAFSGKDITVTFDTEHVDASQALRMPDMSSSFVTDISASMPYLLYEDFSSVGDFSSGDEYTGGSNATYNGIESFLNGWTGGRVGASAGECIRIACRRETSANYGARTDSAPIMALKKSVNISVFFDYGVDNKFSSSLITNPDVGQTVFVGYVTSTDGYKSGSDTGTFEDGNKFYINDHGGSYTNLPYSQRYVLNNIPEGIVRITWRTEIESNAGLTNTTCWLYLDNIKVQIAK